MTEKAKRHTDTVVPAASEKGLSFSLSYRSDAARWTHSLDRRLFHTSPGYWPVACVPATYFSDSYSIGPDGCYPLFPLPVPSYTYSDGASNSRVNLWNEGTGFSAGLAGNVAFAVGSDGNEYVIRADNTVDQFDATTRTLRKRWFATGGWHEYQYSDNTTPASVAPAPDLLIGARDAFGRLMTLNYAANKSLSRVIDPAGRAFELTGGDRLSSVSGPDGLSRSYVYDEPAYVSGFARPGMLTGRFDERNVRTATYGYAADGTARFTERGAGFDRHEVLPPGNTLRSPLGQTITFNWRSLGNGAALVANSVSGCRPDGPCPEWIEGYDHDAGANLYSSSDRLGQRMCRKVDSRNLEISVIEGLPSSAVCNDSVAPGSRKTSTSWHPVWRLRTATAQPGRRTTFVYNGQPDPFNGGAPASCAAAAARLFDGSPIAVLCRQVEQATTDTNGSQGFAAPLEPGVPAREQRWTYNELGQVLTHDGPLPGTADTTSYDYYTALEERFSGNDPNALGVTRGDLKKLTLPAGGFTLYRLYNKLGQVLETEDANGVVTSYAYDLRQRLTRRTVGSDATFYEYWPNGLIKKVTQPDGSWVFYEHDDAHRLYRVSDNLDNSVRYTLDNAGNRTDEQVRDPAGALRRSLSRSIDALSRVRQVTGRE